MRKAEAKDLDAVWQVITEARAKLKADGSPQWQDGHPDRQQIETDLKQGVGCVLMVGQEVAGYAALVHSPEPTYQQIYHGTWNNDSASYMVIHRIAIRSKFSGQHLSTLFMAFLISNSVQRGVKNIRFDTFRLNHALQHHGAKFAFQKRGDIKVIDKVDPWRFAYELNLE
nr:GNAT family N-acetyltransferase [Limosilactobacillus kribbianus]